MLFRSVALAWAALGLVLFEVGSKLDKSAITTQGHALMGFAFGRLFLSNFTAAGEILGLSHRLITIVPIAAMFYYLRLRVRDEQKKSKSVGFETYLQPIYSYGAAALLVILARFEFGRTLTVIAWAALIIIYLVLGVQWRDRDFRFQSYIIALTAFARSWSTKIGRAHV